MLTPSGRSLQNTHRDKVFCGVLVLLSKEPSHCGFAVLCAPSEEFLYLYPFMRKLRFEVIRALLLRHFFKTIDNCRCGYQPFCFFARVSSKCISLPLDRSG